MKLSELKQQIRSVIREQFIDEMSQNDIHFKEIMKFYDKGSSNAKKAISLYCCAKPNATRQQIAGELMDMGYGEIKDVMKHFKLKIEYVDKKGVEHVAAALPQTEEEPVNERRGKNRLKLPKKPKRKSSSIYKYIKRGL